MSFLSDLAGIIETGVASLTIDTNLFVGADVLSAPAKSVTVRTSPGGVENESTMITQAVQVLSKDLSYAAAETIADSVNDVLKNKPGFSALSNVYYCEVIGMPAMIDRDSRGSYIFSANYLFRRR